MMICRLFSTCFHYLTLIARVMKIDFTAILEQSTMIEEIQVQIVQYVKIETESLVPEPAEMCDDSILIAFVRLLSNHGQSV